MVVATIKRRSFPEGINVLSKGDSPFFIPKSMLIEFSFPFYEDETKVDETLFLELKKISECYLCRKKGLDLLAYRDHSKFELSVKLKRRKFSTYSIHNAVDYLKEKNYLNDFKFSELFINSRLRKGEGKFLIFQRLHQKGVSSSIYKDVYEEVVSFDDEKESCIKRFEKITSKTSDKDIVKDKLRKKGFSPSIIREVFEEKHI